MTTLLINSYFTVSASKYPFSRLLSKIKGVLGRKTVILDLKNKLEFLFSSHLKAGKLKLGVIMTTAAFDGYDLTLTYFHENSKDYDHVYRCTLWLDGQSVTSGQITKLMI